MVTVSKTLRGRKRKTYDPGDYTGRDGPRVLPWGLYRSVRSRPVGVRRQFRPKDLVSRNSEDRTEPVTRQNGRMETDELQGSTHGTLLRTPSCVSGSPETTRGLGVDSESKGRTLYPDYWVGSLRVPTSPTTPQAVEGSVPSFPQARPTRGSGVKLSGV